MRLVYKLFWQGYSSRKQKVLLKCLYTELIYVPCITSELFQLNRINTIAPKGEYDGFGMRVCTMFLG